MGDADVLGDSPLFKGDGLSGGRGAGGGDDVDYEGVKV